MAKKKIVPERKIKDWQVITKADVDQQEVRNLLVEHETISPLQPNLVNRLMLNHGLMVHRDEEICFHCYGPDNLDELLKGHPLINDVLPARKAYLA